MKLDIRLDTVSKENLSQVVAIELFDGQKGFVPDIQSSIDLASQYPDSRAVAIFLNDVVCGFSLYGIDEETGKWKVFRLAIDKKYQGKGVGTRVIHKILDILWSTHEAEEVLIVFDIGNSIAHSFYSKLGFVQYGYRGGKVLSKITR